MSKIRLFNPTDTDYSTHGLGGIDAISATVTEELNGSYEMELTYPITGELFSQIGMRSILSCKPNPFDSPEPFRVYKKTDPINGISTIYARHRSYDASGVAIEPFTASNVQDALSGFKSHAVNSNEFTFSTDKTTAGTFKVEKPSTIRSMMGGTQGSIIDVYGGEYEYHDTEIYLKNHRGSDNGVVIEYGKNLTDLNQDKECSSVYTGVYPYFYSEADGTFQLAEKIVNTSGSYSFSKILPLDLSDKFSAKPTEEQLRSAAQSYIESNHIGVPKVSIDIKYVDLSDDPTDPTIGAFEAVRLGDTVTVKFNEMNISATAKVIKTSYDVLESRYSEVTIGDARSTLDATIVDIKKAAEEKPSATFLETAIANATGLLSGVTGGHYILWNNKTKKPENPNEFIITEYAPGDPDHNYLISGHIWRFNLAGWGHSSTGYNGSYSMAATLDGGFIADFITSGVIRALSIIAPKITSDESENPSFYLNGSTGEIKGSMLKAQGSLTIPYTVYSKMEDPQFASEFLAGHISATELNADFYFNYDIDRDGTISQSDLNKASSAWTNKKDIVIDESVNINGNSGFVGKTTITSGASKINEVGFKSTYFESGEMVETKDLMIGGRNSKNGNLFVNDPLSTDVLKGCDYDLNVKAFSSNEWYKIIVRKGIIVDVTAN